MRNWLTRATLIGLVLTLAGNNSVFANSPAVGVPCPTPSQIATVKGVTLVCTNINSHLNKWEKSKPVSVPSTKRAPISTPAPTPTPTSTPTAASGEAPANYLSSPEPLNTCRVPDARSAKQQVSQAIAYPVTSGQNQPMLPRTGVVNIAFIPIDFSDVPGTGNPETFLQPEIDQSKKWVDYFSNGKLQYNIQTTDHWIRASKTSENYEWIHPGSPGNPLPGAKSGPIRDSVAIAQELMATAQSDFNYKGLNVVLFVYPKNVVNIWDNMTTFGTVQTNAGALPIQISATGAWEYSQNLPLWSWFIHENMHPTGLAGHAPNEGSPFNIMTNQSGASLVLDSWDQSILDWQYADEIYCVSASSLQSSVVPMNSIDNNDNTGTKAIFIKLSSHEVLVVESRRNAFWSKGWGSYPGLPKSFRGLLVYKVDTSVDRNRVPDDGGFAVYQKMTGVSNGNYQGPYSPNFDLNSLIEPGQKMTTSGVTISLLKSGTYDTVQISKAS